jgi:threonine/homoserine/homoserine lactone efflux protein
VLRASVRSACGDLVPRSRVSLQHDCTAGPKNLEALRAFLFGVTVAAPVGPIALLLIHTGLNYRLAAALAGALGVALADFTYALVALSAGAGMADLLHGHQRALERASSALLALLGLWLATEAARKGAPASAPGTAKAPGPGLLRLYLLTLANPLTILLFVGFSGQMAVSGGVGAVLYGAVFLFLGSLAVQVGYASFGAALQRWLTTPATVRAFNVTSGLIIAGFGLYGLMLAI